LDDCSAQVFPYNIFAYCSICRIDCKFARNKKKMFFITGHAVAQQMVEALCYKPEGCGLSGSSSIMALKFTHLVTEMSTRRSIWSKALPARKAYNPQPSVSRLSRNRGTLDVSNPTSFHGLLQA
jgi:hypothetical protein